MQSAYMQHTTHMQEWHTCFYSVIVIIVIIWHCIATLIPTGIMISVDLWLRGSCCGLHNDATYF